MKAFFNNYYYSMIKMVINQIAISIFGAVLAMAATLADNDIFTVTFSIFAIVFYLVLIYIMTWEIGAKDRISVDTGRKKYTPHTGLFISLCANSVNLLLAIIYAIGYPSMVKGIEWAGNMNAVVKTIALLVEGMYMGLVAILKLGEQSLNYYWWTYFAMVIPALVTSWIAYYLGHKNFKFISLFTNSKDGKTSR